MAMETNPLEVECLAETGQTQALFPVQVAVALVGDFPTHTTTWADDAPQLVSNLLEDAEVPLLIAAVDPHVVPRWACDYTGDGVVGQQLHPRNSVSVKNAVFHG